jgi:hypothetical protein
MDSASDIYVAADERKHNSKIRSTQQYMEWNQIILTLFQDAHLSKN